MEKCKINGCTFPDGDCLAKREPTRWITSNCKESQIKVSEKWCAMREEIIKEWMSNGHVN